MTSAPSNDDKFYGDAVKYWEGIPATVNGMLGGYGHISSYDINGSLAFLGPQLQVVQSLLVLPSKKLLYIFVPARR